jgi:hypothetical protein
MAEISPLRRRMIEDVTVRNLSPATQRSYIHAVSKFSRHFGRSPDRLGLEDVRAFQVHLVSTGISWPSLNQIVCALRFFYGVTLRQDTIPERIPYAREPRKLPVVLIADEVVRFLEAVSSLKSRVALTTAYAAGLRVSEVVGVKVADIDSQRGRLPARPRTRGRDFRARGVVPSWVFPARRRPAPTPIHKPWQSYPSCQKPSVGADSEWNRRLSGECRPRVDDIFLETSDKVRLQNICGRPSLASTFFWRFERFGRLRSYVRPLSVRSICPRALMKILWGGRRRCGTFGAV